MEWVRGKKIGHGTFATVSLAKPINQSSDFPSIIAVKSCGVSHSASLINERMLLERLQDCPEVIRCFGDSVTIENGVRLYNVALEYASSGTLSERIKNSENLRLSENEARWYTKSVLNGLKSIHRAGVVHCDIKPQNILLTRKSEKGKDKDTFPTVKIADFGLSKMTTRRKESASKNLKNSKNEIRGTPMYLAPETVTSGEQESASDIWAVGCLVTEMITGLPVWDCSDVGALLMKIGASAEIPGIPWNLSDAGKDFLGKCFLKDPRKRWTAEMLLHHPFVKNIVTFKETETENQISPRDPFDFPDWESEKSCCLTPEFECSVGEDEVFRCGSPEISPATRLGQLLTDQKPNWSVGSESWLKVR